MPLRYGGETAYRVLVHMTGFDVMLLNENVVSGRSPPLDPDIRKGDLQVVERDAAVPATARSMSINEAKIFAEGEDAIITVEHNGAGGAGGHFSGYRRGEGRARAKLPKEVKNFIAKYKKEKEGEGRKRNR